MWIGTTEKLPFNTIQDSNGGRRRQSTHRISREDNIYCLLTACYAIALLYPKMEVSACTQQAVTLVEDKALSLSLVVNLVFGQLCWTIDRSDTMNYLVLCLKTFPSRRIGSMRSTSFYRSQSKIPDPPYHRSPRGRFR